MEQLTRVDFLSQVEPKWCQGCGCYIALRTLTGVFPTLGVPKENITVLSGIGCSSRFPYYVDTYGFHTIHGRAPTVATGLKLARPDLSVWMVTGDGDALSIGGNHFLHLMRRNPNIKIILFNNGIYGLTKGQASPTTQQGKTTKSTPFGVLEAPINPLSVAIAAGATFAARTTDLDLDLMNEIMAEAAKHKGVAFVEVMLNCVIFNDGAYSEFTEKTTKAENTIRLKHGAPLVFGAKQEKGIRLNNLKAEIVDLVADPSARSSLLVHDAENPDPSVAFLLSQIDRHEGVPTPMGIFRKVSAPVFEEAHAEKTKQVPDIDFAHVLSGDDSWTES